METCLRFYDIIFPIIYLNKLNFRYCCKDESARLNQSICVDFEICHSYTDTNFNYVNSKICVLGARYCCGTCYNRFCCDNKRDELVQETCLPLTSTSSTNKLTKSVKESSNNSLIYALA